MLAPTLTVVALGKLAVDVIGDKVLNPMVDDVRSQRLRGQLAAEGAT